VAEPDRDLGNASGAGSFFGMDERVGGRLGGADGMAAGPWWLDRCDRATEPPGSGKEVLQ